MSKLPSTAVNKVPTVYSVPPPTLNMPPPSISVIPATQIYGQPPPYIVPPVPVTPPSYSRPPPPSETPAPYTLSVPPQPFVAPIDQSPLFLPPLNVPPPVQCYAPAPIEVITSFPSPPPRIHSNYYLKSHSVKVGAEYENDDYFAGYDKREASKSRSELDYHKARSGEGPSSSKERSFKEGSMPRSSSRYSSEREQYDRTRREKERERELRYRSRSSRSPGHSHKHRSRSPPHMSREEQIARERYYRERQRLFEDREYERKRYEYERRHSPHRNRKSPSRGYDPRYEKSPPRHRYYSPRREHHCHSRIRESSSHSRSRTREISPHSRSHTRDYSPHSRSHTRDISPRSRSHTRDSSPYSRSHIRDVSPHHRSRRRDMFPHSNDISPHYRSVIRDRSPHSRHESIARKPLTDREKILEEYRKNYCQTSEDLMEKIEQWSKEHKSDDEEEAPKMWYRSSPAELYYNVVDGSRVKQTNKLEKICDIFFERLIERGRIARPMDDELPPLKPQKAKMCHHKEDNSSSASSSSDSDDLLDEEGLQGYTDRIMLELQRKQSHPRRLHPEMWFNNTGEMNGGPLCRCSARARRHGMRHGVYSGELSFPKCLPNESNIDKLYHYRITVSPPTNFLIKAPTIIGHDEHEFLFSGFSMFSHYKLKKLPTCKVIRFNIEYTILYVEEPPPQNFTVRELDLFEEYLFTELLELVDLDLGRATETGCSQFHFMPRFVRFLAEGGCEVLSMCEVLKYLIDESGLLIPPQSLEKVHEMDHYTWQKFVDRIKGMIVTYPGKKPCSVRVDQLDRSAPNEEAKLAKKMKTFYPEIVHFGIRPPQLSYAGNPEYQKAWRYYVKYRHLIANMAKPSYNERQKLASKEANLQEMRTQSKMKRDVTVAITSEGFHTTGLMCDVVQHAMLIPVLVRHLRFHKSLDSLESKIGYVFKQRALLQTALTHPSYRENFGTNPDHARNSLTNCGIRQPQYGDRRIHYTRKKDEDRLSHDVDVDETGIVTLINIMSRFGKHAETESEIKHNERLEFLGDAVVEFLSSIHLFRMFPGLAEGGLATYRAAIVQNQHLAQLAKNIDLEQFMLYAHGSDLCRDVVMRHAMANCFEALMGALFLDAHIEVADRVFSLALWHNEAELLEVWTKDRGHPLQEQEPLGDRKYIKDFEFLQSLTKFEDSIGVQFKHIRLLARAFTDRSVGFTHLTLGSNQRLEFLGDTVLQLVVSDRLYRHFPDHHEGHLSLLRSSLVNNRTQSMVCDDLNMSSYAIYNNPKAKPTTKKHKADLLEAFLGALYIDKGLEYCQAFCNACLFPRLQEFIMNQDWNDPKSKLQQCCLTLRSMEGGEPDIPLYKVIECLGPTNTRVYTVGVYFRGRRLASARGHSIQEAEMNAAEEALNCAHELFPQLDHQKRVIANSMCKKKSKSSRSERERLKHKYNEDKVPKAYRLDNQDSSDASSTHEVSDTQSIKSNEDSGLDSDSDGPDDKALDNVKVSSLVSDMEKIKEDLIRKNKYEELKEKCRKSDSDGEE